ncbi:MAG: phosphatase PAP2 family protein, partial [Tannerellaceae bacterium]|nr:phosphatase PAP2 family protein [Tannerellaceae bacterium]
FFADLHCTRAAVTFLEETWTSYSFFSGHSSNSFCLAVFTTLYFRNKIYGIAIFAWALAVAYSRIYVGKHYPLDVIVGILFGFLTGWLYYWFYKKYTSSKGTGEDLEL